MSDFTPSPAMVEAIAADSKYKTTVVLTVLESAFEHLADPARADDARTFAFAFMVPLERTGWVFDNDEAEGVAITSNDTKRELPEGAYPLYRVRETP